RANESSGFAVRISLNMAIRSIDQVSGVRCQVSDLSEKPMAKSQEPKAASHSYHAKRYNGCSPRNRFGLPLFCAAGNRERRVLAASFASAIRSGMDWRLPRLRTRVWLHSRPAISMHIAPGKALFSSNDLERPVLELMIDKRTDRRPDT